MDFAALLKSAPDESFPREADTGLHHAPPLMLTFNKLRHALSDEAFLGLLSVFDR